MVDSLTHGYKASIATVAAQITGTHTDNERLVTALGLPWEMLDSDGAGS